MNSGSGKQKNPVKVLIRFMSTKNGSGLCVERCRCSNVGSESSSLVPGDSGQVQLQGDFISMDFSKWEKKTRRNQYGRCVESEDIRCIFCKKKRNFYFLKIWDLNEFDKNKGKCWRRCVTVRFF